MSKLLLGSALAIMLVGCASDSGNKGAVGESGAVGSGSDTKQAHHRNTPPNLNMRNWSIDNRAP